MENTRRNACDDLLQSLNKMTERHFEDVVTLKEKIESIKLLDVPPDEAAPVKNEFWCTGATAQVSPVSLGEAADARPSSAGPTYPFLVKNPASSGKEDKVDNGRDDKKCAVWRCKKPAATVREYTCSMFKCKTVCKAGLCESCARSRFLVAITLCESCKSKCKKVPEKIEKALFTLAKITALLVIGFLAFVAVTLPTLTLMNRPGNTQKSGPLFDALGLHEPPARHANTPPLTDQNYGTVWLHGEYTFRGWENDNRLTFDKHEWENGRRTKYGVAVYLNDSNMHVFKSNVKESKISHDDVFEYTKKNACPLGSFVHKRTGQSFCLAVEFPYQRL